MSLAKMPRKSEKISSLMLLRRFHQDKNTPESRLGLIQQTLDSYPEVLELLRVYCKLWEHQFKMGFNPRKLDIRTVEYLTTSNSLSNCMDFDSTGWKRTDFSHQRWGFDEQINETGRLERFTIQETMGLAGSRGTIPTYWLSSFAVPGGSVGFDGFRVAGGWKSTGRSTRTGLKSISVISRWKAWFAHTSQNSSCVAASCALYRKDRDRRTALVESGFQWCTTWHMFRDRFCRGIPPAATT